jgi:hypothetical protein
MPEAGEKLIVDGEEVEVIAQTRINGDDRITERMLENQGITHSILVRSKNGEEMVRQFKDGHFEFARRYTRGDGKDY